MKTADFDYALPPELIAQTPVEPRDHSRLMVLCRANGGLEHRHFWEIGEYLRPGDLLVANESRVLAARLRARKEDTGGRVELLLVRQIEERIWETLVKPGRRIRPGTRLLLEEAANGAAANLSSAANDVVVAEVLERTSAGGRLVRFSDDAKLEQLGRMPLPPYIHVPLVDPERYQTVYARRKGSAAAPTAGLHFTPRLMEELRQKGVDFSFVTLHIGLDTFRPVQAEDPCDHQIHTEYCLLNRDTSEKIRSAKAEGRRVIAVGTTTVRTLETAARATGQVEPFEGWTDLFIYPGYRFRVVDALITNFHLPRSSLLMLVSAFAGQRPIQCSYAEAVRERYRFFSFGDAMLIT